VNQAGTYLWTAMYSGDANNTSVSSPCGSESVVVKAPPPPSSITGGTVITIGGPAVATLQSHGCGTLMASVANGATVFTGVHNEIRISLKINGYMMQPNGAYRLSFAGAVTLTNSCYTITFDAFRLSNFGLGVPVTTFNVKAISHSSGRQLAGTLDLSGATVTVTGSKTRVEKMDLFLSAGGAELLNTLATGTPNGPFSPGEKVGFAKTTVVFH
jgi:hypothetical protein